MKWVGNTLTYAEQFAVAQKLVVADAIERNVHNWRYFTLYGWVN